MMMKTLGKHCETTLYIMKFHLLDHILEDPEVFDILDVLT